jgi:hypothetical protein
MRARTQRKLAGKARLACRPCTSVGSCRRSRVCARDLPSTCESPPDELARTHTCIRGLRGICAVGSCAQRTCGRDVTERECSFVGGEKCAQRWEALQAHGITHVVNCTAATCPDAFADRPSSAVRSLHGMAWLGLQPRSISWRASGVVRAEAGPHCTGEVGEWVPRVLRSFGGQAAPMPAVKLAVRK